jgi:hypothetical protein
VRSLELRNTVVSSQKESGLLLAGNLSFGVIYYRKECVRGLILCYLGVSKVHQDDVKTWVLFQNPLKELFGFDFSHKFLLKSVT